MAKTPRFNYVVENIRKNLKENSDGLTPNLTGSATGTQNPSATPTSQQNPNQNKKFDEARATALRNSLSAYAEKSQASTGIATPNPNVAQTPAPGQGPTNPQQPVGEEGATTMTSDEHRDFIYQSLRDLGFTDDMIHDKFKKQA